MRRFRKWWPRGRWHVIEYQLRKPASAPWRFANYGRGSVQAADSTEPRASASGQAVYANFRDLALQRDSAVDANHLAGDVVIRLEQEADSSRNILGPAKSPDRAILEITVVLTGCNAWLRHAGVYNARRNHIDANVCLAAQLLR